MKFILVFDLTYIFSQKIVEQQDVPRYRISWYSCSQVSCWDGCQRSEKFSNIQDSGSDSTRKGQHRQAIRIFPANEWKWRWQIFEHVCSEREEGMERCKFKQFKDQIAQVCYSYELEFMWSCSFDFIDGYCRRQKKLVCTAQCRCRCFWFLTFSNQ